MHKSTLQQMGQLLKRLFSFDSTYPQLFKNCFILNLGQPPGWPLGLKLRRQQTGGCIWSLILAFGAKPKPT